MNYKAELRGFALDRAIRAAEINDEVLSLDQVITNADRIVDYLYIPDKDIKSLLEAAIPLIAQNGDLERLASLILELQQIEAEIKANIQKPTELPKELN